MLHDSTHIVDVSRALKCVQASSVWKQWQRLYASGGMLALQWHRQFFGNGSVLTGVWGKHCRSAQQTSIGLICSGLENASGCPSIVLSGH